ncbi:hypothetical protein ACFL59_07345 [Planctomycetota bacterium]
MSVLAVAYATGAALVFLLALLPVEISIRHFLYEDFFYYLKIAQNIAEGRGATLDGFSTTNGFHPLWMLLCVVVRLVFDGTTAVHAVLLLAACLHLLQVYLVYRIVDLDCGGVWAHAVALFYLVNYRIIACNLCGMETPLAASLFLLLVYLMLSCRTLGVLRVVGFGVLMGIASLARLDLLLFCCVVIVWILVRPAGGASPIRRTANATIAAVVWLLTLFPWFLWSYATSQALLPNSRVALRLMAGFGLDLHASPGEMLSQVAGKVSSAALWLPDTANLLGLWPTVLPGLAPVASSLVVTALLALAGFMLTNRAVVNRIPKLLLMLYACAHLAYYVFWARAEVRYLIPSCVVVILLVPSVLQYIWKRFDGFRTRVLVASLCACVLVNSAVAGILAWHYQQGPSRWHSFHQDLCETARWMRRTLPEHANVGAWNAGILCYFSDRTVVNLDGVVNDDALAALRDRRLQEYIEQRNIRFIADLRAEVNSFMIRFSGDHAWGRKYVTAFLHPRTRVVVLERRPSGMSASERRSHTAPQPPHIHRGSAQ